MNYNSALQFLSERGNEVQGISLGLHRMQAIMQALGNPQLRFPALHIAGTNGKGSVAALSESILRHAGLRTALYTSPHLVRLEERIQVGGRQISPAMLAALVEAVREPEDELLRSAAIERRLTYFEFLTACAFLWFCRRKVDVAVVEVGLGGMLDATNVVSPQTCVITGIAYDHQQILGNTLTAIAREKAGIIKPGIPVVSGCRPREARRVIRDKAREAGAPLIEIDLDCRLSVDSFRKGRPVITLRTPFRTYKRLAVPLAGEHQARNAALAVTATEQMPGSGLTPRSVRSGVAATRWPGRLDEYRARRRTLLEGAHNPEGAKMLRSFLLSQQESEVHLVFGAVRDKDIGEMTAALFPLAASIHLTPFRNSRSAAPRDIEVLHPRFRQRIDVHPNSRAALETAWNRCSRSGLVVVTGSLYLVGELLPLVREAAKTRA